MPQAGSIWRVRTILYRSYPSKYPKYPSEYFIKRKVREDQVTASKPFEQGYRIHDAKSTAIHKVSNPFSAIKAAVLPSQRMDKVYETIAVVYNITGNVYYHRSGNFHVNKVS